MPSPVDAYPLATKDGDAIRLEVVEGLSSVKVAIAAAASPLIVMPTTTQLLLLFGTAPFMIGFGTPPVALVVNTPQANTLIIPANTLYPYAVKIPDSATLFNFSIIAATASTGDAFITSIRNWKDLNRNINYARK